MRAYAELGNENITKSNFEKPYFVTLALISFCWIFTSAMFITALATGATKYDTVIYSQYYAFGALLGEEALSVAFICAGASAQALGYLAFIYQWRRPSLLLWKIYLFMAVFIWLLMDLIFTTIWADESTRNDPLRTFVGVFSWFRMATFCVYTVFWTKHASQVDLA